MEILRFINGEVDYTVGEFTYHLEKGDTLVIPPHTMHYIQKCRPEVCYERMILWVSMHFFVRMAYADPQLQEMIDLIGKRKLYLVRLGTSGTHAIDSLFETLATEMSNPGIGHSLICRHYVSELIILLCRCINDSKSINYAMQNIRIINSLTSYIGKHLTENLSLDMLSKIFFLSKHYIAHCFKQQLLIPLHKYIIKQRLMMARELIIEGVPISTLPETVGFSDYSLFFRAFKKEFGISPREFKKQVDQNNDIIIYR